jgi:hypothetical protein
MRSSYLATVANAFEVGDLKYQGEALWEEKSLRGVYPEAVTIVR